MFDALDEANAKVRARQADEARHGYGRIAGESAGAGMDVDRQVNQALSAASEGIRSRAMRKAVETGIDSERHQRLAQKLTPEIETALWCLQEALALGLMDLPKSRRGGDSDRY